VSETDEAGMKARQHLAAVLGDLRAGAAAVVPGKTVP
jgi:hypothetical protein